MMRKLLFLFVCVTFALPSIAQKKYVHQVFTRANVKTTKNVMYSRNYSVLKGQPFYIDTLRMDVYEPDQSVDNATARPLIIMTHTGSFLPRYVNNLATGARDDSATVEICKNFAQRGYVVASISYRLGWNPLDTTETLRRQGIINAAYKGVQDLSSAVRWFKSNVKNGGNSYKIDSTKICVGGQGTGGYITFAYSTLDRQSEINIPKFYNFTSNRKMVNDSFLWGDRMGFGGAVGLANIENHKGHTSNAQCAFSFGGAMGDSSWLESGTIPLISAHAILDPFAPYKTGIVKVPGTNLNVVQVSGGGDVMARANRIGNNTIYKNKVADVYTEAANKLNGGNDGLFPIATAVNSSGAWEWWDTTAIRTLLTFAGFTLSSITTIFNNSKASNPLMSKARALLFIDSITGYFAPRIAITLGYYTDLSKNKFSLQNVAIYPNPSTGKVFVNNYGIDNSFTSVKALTIDGKVVAESSNNNKVEFKLSKGIYFIQIQSLKGNTTEKIIVQ